MTLERWMEIQNHYEQKTHNASLELNQACEPHTNNMGLVDDSFKQTEKYKRLKRAYNNAFNELRTFNSLAPKNYRSKAAKVRRQRQLQINASK